MDIQKLMRKKISKIKKKLNKKKKFLMTENLAAFLSSSSSSSSSSVQVENFEECINITSVFKSMSLYLIHRISIDRSCSFQNVLFKKNLRSLIF